jgi:hypothetical protein
MLIEALHTVNIFIRAAIMKSIRKNCVDKFKWADPSIPEADPV